MKTSVDIPENELLEAMRYAGATTKREAIVLAIREFNHRRRLAALIKHAGTCDTLATAADVQALRRKS